jgi:endonuclease/exonuclease/phosphatase family metal-dependent hydrolase
VRADEKPRLRVMTYNIHHCQGTDGKFDLERIAKIINDHQPDLVALQEVDRKTKRSSGVDQIAELARLTGMQYQFGKSMNYDGGEYGNAVLSRYAADTVKVHPLPSENNSEPRTALAVKLRPRKTLPMMVFINTHLCHQSGRNRTAQIREINRLYPAGSRLPTILAGDLNAREGAGSMKETFKHWNDAMQGISTIDYVLLHKGNPWKTLERKVIEDRVASDHQPVLVVLEWQG